METRDQLIFSRNGKRTVVTEMDPHETVLDYLRLREGSMGTKEGCCEGDCGACTVVVRTMDGEQAKYEAINSCIAPLGSMDGKDLITVDDLASDGSMHPVQQAIVDKHASQCGFCTPGFVMALYALYENANGPVDRPMITDGLAGNLCRCTGYRPIVEAGLAACNGKSTESASQGHLALLTELEQETETSLYLGNGERFFAAPTSEDELAALYENHPDATLVAGATDVGLWITKHLNKIEKIIYLGRVAGFRTIETSSDGLNIGAGATYTDAETALGAIDPDVAEVVRRIGSAQVRNAGTIGGNIANGSPIGDTPPLLIALDATLTLRKGNIERQLPLEEFFIDYGKQDRAVGEFVKSIFVPAKSDHEFFRAFKLSKRFDQDISAVLMAMKLTMDGTTIQQARIAYGGMAATPKRAASVEQLLTGADINNLHPTVLDALSQDYAPISDMRASASYRLQSAGGLLQKALLEIAEEVAGNAAETRLVGQRGSAA